MNPIRLFLALAFGLSGMLLIAQLPQPADAPKPLSPTESLKRVQLAPGYRLELIASEPLIHEPSGLCWDERGRLFVSELHGYNLEGQFDIEELNKSGKLDRSSGTVRWRPGSRYIRLSRLN